MYDDLHSKTDSHYYLCPVMMVHYTMELVMLPDHQYGTEVVVVFSGNVTSSGDQNSTAGSLVVRLATCGTGIRDMFFSLGLYSSTPPG